MSDVVPTTLSARDGLDPDQVEVPPLSFVDTPGWALLRLARYTEDALREAHLTLRQYFALTLIAHGPLSPTEVAQRSNTSGPSATMVLRDLINLGFVKRHISTADQRRVWVMLTKDGQSVLSEANSRIESRIGEIAGYFSSKKAQTDAQPVLASWNGALDRFRHGWLATHRDRPAAGRPPRTESNSAR